MHNIMARIISAESNIRMYEGEIGSKLKVSYLQASNNPLFVVEVAIRV